MVIRAASGVNLYLLQNYSISIMYKPRIIVVHHIPVTILLCTRAFKNKNNYRRVLQQIMTNTDYDLFLLCLSGANMSSSCCTPLKHVFIFKYFCLHDIYLTIDVYKISFFKGMSSVVTSLSMTLL